MPVGKKAGYKSTGAAVPFKGGKKSVNALPTAPPKGRAAKAINGGGTPGKSKTTAVTNVTGIPFKGATTKGRTHKGTKAKMQAAAGKKVGK